MKPERIRSIDAARGTAMLFVFLSHFAQVYFRRDGQLSLLRLAYDITMIASPTFMIISGIMLGFFYRSQEQNFDEIKQKFIGRGLFLFTIGHVVILVAHILYAGGVKQALHWGFMTDAIGFCLIVGPMIIREVPLQKRLLLSVFIFVASWFFIFFWNPGLYPLMVFKEAFFGPVDVPGKHLLADVFPMLPWFSVYLVGTCLGEKLAGDSKRGRRSRISAVLLRTGLMSIAVALVTRGIWAWIFSPGTTEMGLELHNILSLSQKSPPAITYVMAYGGCGLLVLGFLLKFEHVGAVQRYIDFTEVFGRTSLFVFMFQYYVYFALLSVANLKSPVLWPLYFMISIALIHNASRLWDHYNLNRYLTLPPVPYSRPAQTA